MGKWYSLAERYVAALERVAVAHEINNELQRRNVAANEKSAAAWGDRAQQRLGRNQGQKAPLVPLAHAVVVPELGSVVDAMSSLASTIASLKGDWSGILARLAEATALAGTDTKEGT